MDERPYAFLCIFHEIDKYHCRFPPSIVGFVIGCRGRTVTVQRQNLTPCISYNGSNTSVITCSVVIVSPSAESFANSASFSFAWMTAKSLSTDACSTGGR